MNDTLRLVFWELTARCNLACRHCRAEAQAQAAEGELSTSEMLAVARDIRATGDPILILTGGEPLVRPDFFALAEECCRIFTRVALATNGTLVDDELAARIRASGIQRASVSIDGAGAASHDVFRGQVGSFDAALRGLDAFRNAGLSVQVNTTVTQDNLREVGDILDLARQHGADAFHLFVLVPVGCGAEIGGEMRLSPAEVERVLHWLHAKSVELRGRVHVKATCAPQYYRLLSHASPAEDTRDPGHPHQGGMQAMTRGCLAGSTVCFVSRTGDVQPCGYLPMVAGNVRQRPFGEIWREAPEFAALRDLSQLKGKCGVCHHRQACGGCRARAFADTGDFLGADPDCAYVPPARGTQGTPRLEAAST